MAHGQPLGTLWIVSEEEGHFDSGHARIMRELASFAGIALAMLQNQRQLQEALAQQEMLTREMDHRVNNVFFVINGMIQVGKRSARSTVDFAETLSGRLHALAASHALVRHSSATALSQPAAASLHDLTGAIFKPYEAADTKRFIVTGDHMDLGDRAITSLALVFHELATNAAKYGALSRDEGRVSVSWQRQGEALAIRWQEDGGPPIMGPPERHGFGSSLLRNTVVRRFGGALEPHWRKQGLIVEFTVPLTKLAS
jgi:two-component sensor histidine kinase